MRQSGYLANNGLRDQANALRWIQKFIKDFGGDPDSVTFIGESAGSGRVLLSFKLVMTNLSQSIWVVASPHHRAIIQALCEHVRNLAHDQATTSAGIRVCVLVNH